MAAEGGGPPPDLTTGPPVDIEPTPRGPLEAATRRPCGGNGQRLAGLVRLDGHGRRLFEQPYDFTFFQAVRLLQQIFPGREPVGRGGAL